MTQRITQKNLEALATIINEETGNPVDTYARNEEGKLVAQPGNYHISYAYGGAALHRVCNEGGGIRDIFGGHMPKRELWERMHAFRRGFEAAREG